MIEGLQCKVICMERLAENNQIGRELVDLASQYLPDSIQLKSETDVESLQGDAGFRCYYRISTQPTVLGVSASPEKEDWVSFMRVSSLLGSLGVKVPTIYVADLESGKLLIEDLGDCLYQDALDGASSKKDVDQLYQGAIRSLHKIVSCEDRPAWLPRYTTGLLRQEMELFPFWFVKKLLGYSIDAAESRLISSCFSHLAGCATGQPQVLVHRDYHCRNLLNIDAKEPGVIDFQDAVWGPLTYDLVSLSRDCYLRWEPGQVDSVRDSFAEQLLKDGVINEQGLADFPSWFETMSAQRHLKVVGIFARLALRDEKTAYLENLPLALRYLLEACEREAELQEFGDWIQSKLLPHIEKQSWYSDWRQAGNQVTVW